jgi:hypothetical protein
LPPSKPELFTYLLVLGASLLATWAVCGLFHCLFLVVLMDAILMFVIDVSLKSNKKIISDQRVCLVNHRVARYVCIQ